jgi:N-acetylneuraminic acid mutarotase
MCGHSIIPKDDKLLVFGGLDPESGTVYSQVFVYYPTEKNWGKNEQNKTPRFCGSLAIITNTLYFIGGCNLVTRSVPSLEKLDLSTLTVDLLA